MAVAVTLVGAATIAIGAFAGLGAWIAAVLAGGLLGGIATLSAIGIVASSAGVLAPTREAAVDPVTGLANVHRLDEDLDAALTRSLRDSRVTLFAFVLDGLKNYNDSYGDPCGDAMLAWLGRKLRDVLDDRASAYRMRGAAFAVLVTGSEALANELHDRGGGGARRGRRGLPDHLRRRRDRARLGVALRRGGDRACISPRPRPPAHHRRADAHHRPFEESIDVWRLVAPGYDVAALALRVGRRLGMSQAALQDLDATARLRDVGNIAIPAAVLTRSGGLPGHEWEFIRLHTMIGERLLATNFEMEHIASLVRSSHERWDGDGYPDGLAGEQTPLAARIVFVCSAFADMTTARPHRVARDTTSALRELERAPETSLTRMSFARSARSSPPRATSTS